MKRTPLFAILSGFELHDIPGVGSFCDFITDKKTIQAALSMSTLSLAWAVADKRIVSTIAGSRNVVQLKDNVQGATYSLSPEVYAKLNEITQPILDKLGDNPDYWENRKESRIR